MEWECNYTSTMNLLKREIVQHEILRISGNLSSKRGIRCRHSKKQKRCGLYHLIRLLKNSKLDLKLKKCIFLDYEKEVKGYKFWDPVAQKLVISTNVVFDEKLISHEIWLIYVHFREILLGLCCNSCLITLKWMFAVQFIELHDLCI